MLQRKPLRMSRTTVDLLGSYRKTVKRRDQQRPQELECRRACAWETARKAARLLKEEFGATRVVLFGSLAHSERFTLWSDVDLAAWRIRPEDAFRAVAAVLGVDSEIEINLVDMSMCRPALRETIEREGIEL